MLQLFFNILCIFEYSEGKREIYEKHVLIVAESSYYYDLRHFNSLVAKIIIHKSFDRASNTNDIALVNIRMKIQENSKYFIPIKLAIINVRAGKVCIRTSLGISEKVGLSRVITKKQF